MSWQFLQLNQPFPNWILCRKLFNKFEISPFCANWHTPFLLNWPTIRGPKYLFCLFFVKRPPSNLDFCIENCWQIFNFVQFGLIVRHPHLPKTNCKIGPKYLCWLFFHEIDSFQFGFYIEKKILNFKIGTFKVDWKTPIFSKKMPISKL